MRDQGRFEQITADAIATLPPPLLAALADAELLVEEIPPAPQRPDGEVPLAEFRPAKGGGPARITVYRRPIEARSQGRVDLVELLRVAVGREVAFALGLDVDLDDDDWD